MFQPLLLHHAHHPHLDDSPRRQRRRIRQATGCLELYDDKVGFTNIGRNMEAQNIRSGPNMTANRDDDGLHSGGT